MRRKLNQAGASVIFAPMVLAGYVGLGLTPPAAGQCNDIKILSSGGAADDRFGWSVSVSGAVAVIGALGSINTEISTGSANVYRFDGSVWVDEQTLLASDGAGGDSFGSSVAVSGGVAVIGANMDDDRGNLTGSAYVYRFDGSTWVQEQKLLAADVAAGDEFGFSVAVSGNVAVIGVAGDDDLGNSSGSAYIYRFDGSVWVEEQKLLAPDGAPTDLFGWSVSVSGDLAVIGATLDDDLGSASGSAYIYRYDGSTWGQEAKLLASDGAAIDFFGHSVSVSGDVAVIAASGDDDTEFNSGSAYVYRFDGSAWVQEQKLSASDAARSAHFGDSVSVDGDLAVIGALTDDDLGSGSGSAYVYHFDGSAWREVQKLLASDGATSDFFGNGVSVSGDVAVIGASGEDESGFNFGAAYVFGDLFDCTAIACTADADGSGDVGIGDFLAVLMEWGTDCMVDPCTADANADGTIGIDDFLKILADWGACP